MQRHYKAGTVRKARYNVSHFVCKSMNDDAVEAHSCIDIVAKFTDEQYTTTNQSTVGRFDPRVFSCQLLTSREMYERILSLHFSTCNYLLRTACYIYLWLIYLVSSLITSSILNPTGHKSICTSPDIPLTRRTHSTLTILCMILHDVCVS